MTREISRWETTGGDAFLYRSGMLTDLGPGQAYGISNSDQVVGTLGFDAFSYQNGIFTDLGIPFGNYGGIARAVNDSGAIAGYSESNVNTPGAMQTSWLINGPSMTNLGVLPGGLDLTNVFGMNNSSRLSETLALLADEMFIWSPSTGMVDLGLGEGDANAINNQGNVVGFFEGAQDDDAFLYHNGVTIDLQQSVFGPAVVGLKPHNHQRCRPNRGIRLLSGRSRVAVSRSVSSSRRITFL